ncbi:MAG: TlpA family protein disulfide reductase [Bacteroidales bacterium]|nr:TlpA family protein disulfide reductase [Bacteroidales bacterium]
MLTIKQWVQNYFSRKKPFAIISDFIFIILVVLLLIPTTRKEVSAFFIRMVSFPPSELNVQEQYNLSPEVGTWPIQALNGYTMPFGGLEGKPVVVNFWATWCPPCRAELPGLQELYEEYKGRVNFAFLSDEPAATIKKFSVEHQYQDLPFFRYTTVPKDFETRSIPATFIISPTGKVVLEKKGAARWDSGKVKSILDKLLNSQKQ